MTRCNRRLTYLLVAKLGMTLKKSTGTKKRMRYFQKLKKVLNDGHENILDTVERMTDTDKVI